MEALFQQVEFWHWWVVATAILLLETVSGTFYLLWISFAAAVVGLVLLIVPLGGEVQLMLFAVLSMSSVVAWHRWRAKQPERPTDQPALNRRGQQYIGRQFTLDDAIVNGQGKLRVDDTSWRVSGPDLPAGRTVRVVRADGATLVVEAAGS